MRALFGLACGLLIAGVGETKEINTSGTAHVQNPVWSPDGSWLAYETNNLSNSVELWLVQINGGLASQPRQLRIPGASRSFGGGGSVVAAPAWTTKPQMMLFFEGSNAGGLLRLYYAMPGSASPSELITTSTVQGNLSSPAMSADGSLFAFSSDASGAGDIFAWELAGGGTPKVVANTEESENFPAINATGDRLAFSRKGNGEDLFFWSTSGDSGRLSRAAGDQTRAVWAGDEVLYFSSERGGDHWDVRAVSGEGGSSRLVARDVRLPVRAGPAVTPDAKHVVVVSSDPAMGDRIQIVAIDGSGTTEIETGLVACGEPAVVEVDGRSWLAFTALPAAGADWRGLHVIDITGRY
jgi:Tol biopolymer transport system component